MKIAVLSDLHFGYAYGTELEEDSFDNAEEAMEAALATGPDLLIIPGDIFDSRLPKTSVWARAIKILVKPLLRGSSGVKLVSSTKIIKPITERTLKGIPVIALHGTHERRHGTNAIQALDHAGILIHLDCETIVFENRGVRVALHGMSGVPDRYAKYTLEEWNPQPLPDCVNILLMHQSIDPFIYSPLGTVSLHVDNLPKGFDLIINGHLHSSGKEVASGTLLLMPGSTIITQLEKNEAGAEKGFYELDIETDTIGNKKIDFKFHALQKNRKFFFEDVGTAGGLRQNVENKLGEILQSDFAKKPLVKIKITGNESEFVEQDLREIERKYSGQMILRFVKELESPEIVEKVEFLRNLRELKMSAEEIGLNLLHKNLEELEFGKMFDDEKVFGLLTEGDVDNAFDILTGSQKTLESFGG